jgi:hypothetical protein
VGGGLPPMAMGIYTIFRDWRVPLWRAGLSNRRTARVGLRSSPKTSFHRVSDTPRSSLLGLLRSPTRDKPARHNSPICRAFSVEQKLCRYPCPDGHGYLHNVVAAKGNHDAKRVALDLAVDLDLRRPPKSLSDYGHTEPGRGAEWWGEAFCLLLRFSKVSRRKGGTHSRRYRSNGYVLIPTPANGRPRGRHRGQVESSHRPSHI